jgi:hypothetical protein
MVFLLANFLSVDSIKVFVDGMNRGFEIFLSATVAIFD